MFKRFPYSKRIIEPRIFACQTKPDFPLTLIFGLAITSMTLDKKGFSNKFFEELDKEHDNAKTMAKRQKQLKDKHKKLTRKGQN